MSRSVSPQHPFKIFNVECLRASASFALAWGCWQAHGPQTMIFGFMAVIFAAVGVKRMWFALAALVRLIKSRRKIERFKASGAAPKADRMAGDDDLRARGLIK